MAFGAQSSESSSAIKSLSTRASASSKVEGGESSTGKEAKATRTTVRRAPAEGSFESSAMHPNRRCRYAT